MLVNPPAVGVDGMMLSCGGSGLSSKSEGQKQPHAVAVHVADAGLSGSVSLSRGHFRTYRREDQHGHDLQLGLLTDA